MGSGHGLLLDRLGGLSSQSALPHLPHASAAPILRVRGCAETPESVYGFDWNGCTETTGAITHHRHSGRSAILRFVEPMSRYRLAMAPQAHDATRLLSCLTGLLERSPGQDGAPSPGTRDGASRELAVDTRIEIFFAEPHHRFERPSKKAFNGLLRR